MQMRPIKLPDLQNTDINDPNKKTVLYKNIEKQDFRQALEFRGSKDTDSEDSTEEHFISPYNNIARFANDASSRKSSQKAKSKRRKKVSER